MKSLSQPLFISGRPVVGHEFLNREQELKTIFNQLQGGESTAVVGEPHIGKSLVLMQITNKGVCQKYLGSEADELIFSYLGLHPMWDIAHQSRQPCEGHLSARRIQRR